MSSERARAFFDAIARRYDREYALSGALSRERLSRVQAIISGKKRVLVLGIGTGRELPALLDAGHDVQALELSPKMIALCNQRSRRVPITEGDFYAPLPFANASFDAVLALHGTLAHPPRDGAFADLAEGVARVLEADGVFVAEVPSAIALNVLPAAPEGLRIVVTSPTTFVHHDDREGVSIDGIALDAAGWQAALSPALDVQVTPLGTTELMIVARPSRKQADPV